MANKNTKQKIRRNRAKPQHQAGIVSTSPKRNMAQVVYHNVDNEGRKSSLTRHEPLDSTRYIRGKGHNYMPAVRQPIADSSTPKPQD